MIRGETQTHHEQLVTMVNAHASAEPMRCVRTVRYSYIRRYEHLPHRVMPNVDAGLSKSVLADLGWRDMPEPAEALYDLALDPMERCNLADDPRYADTLADMRSRLETWQETYDDPIRRGPIDYGQSAVLDDQSRIDPT